MNVTKFNGLLDKIREQMVGKRNTLQCHYHYVFHDNVWSNDEATGISFIFCGFNCTISAFNLYEYDKSNKRWIHSTDIGTTFYNLTLNQNKMLRELIDSYLN